jgi:peptidyl-dipeptidase Dcp
VIWIPTQAFLTLPVVVEAFKETGDIFDKATAASCRQYIYSSGNSADPAELFRQFRGRDPVIQFMLQKKGLAEESAAQ